MIWFNLLNDENHMMDFNLGHWIPVIIGLGIFLLALIVIVYIVIQSTRSARKINQMNSQILKRNKNKSDLNINGEENEQNVVFCYYCGYKLQEDKSRYCPRCGTKV
jgi:uncharacterized paraquat-inducible protein A